MEEEIERLKIVIYGAGAIGATLGGWLTQNYENVYLLARGDNAKAMKSNGLVLYTKEKNDAESIPVNVIEDLNELSSIDVVVIAVKNYNLKEVAKDISMKLGDKPVIVALQNGIENQKILPKYFTKIIYGTIVIGAWQDNPGIFGNRGKGEIILGTIENKNQEMLEKVSKIFNLGFPTTSTNKLQEAAHSKLVINLLNSLFTLVNSKLQDNTAIFKLWKIYANVFLEGVKIIQAAGYQEYKLKYLPSWKTMEFALDFDKVAAVNDFKKNLKFYRLNSMAQDMILRQKNQSELESLNGYLIKLADSHGLEVPYNRTIYKLCKEQFSKTPYRPLAVEIVWEKINENLK